MKGRARANLKNFQGPLYLCDCWRWNLKWNVHCKIELMVAVTTAEDDLWLPLMSTFLSGYPGNKGFSVNCWLTGICIVLIGAFTLKSMLFPVSVGSSEPNHVCNGNALFWSYTSFDSNTWTLNIVTLSTSGGLFISSVSLDSARYIFLIPICIHSA